MACLTCGLVHIGRGWLVASAADQRCQVHLLVRWQSAGGAGVADGEEGRGWLGRDVTLETAWEGKAGAGKGKGDGGVGDGDGSLACTDLSWSFECGELPWEADIDACAGVHYLGVQVESEREGGRERANHSQ